MPATRNVAVLLFPDVELLDFAGPVFAVEANDRREVVGRTGHPRVSQAPVCTADPVNPFVIRPSPSTPSV